jgi:O-antigen/teichoic acid export membrane protein
LYENSERIFGSSYAGVGSVLLIVTLCAIPLGISSIAATFLSAVGEEKFVSRLSICTIPANIVLLIYTSNKHGAFGAAIGVLLVNVALAILYSFQSWKAYKNLD